VKRGRHALDNAAPVTVRLDIAAPVTTYALATTTDVEHGWRMGGADEISQLVLLRKTQ
jgi:hypothetical protein